MRILLVKTSSLGDVIHSLPVATDLARRFPGMTLDWVVEESFSDLPRLHPAVRRVLPVAVRRWRKRLLAAATWREMRAFKATLRAETYDAVLDTQGLLKSGLIAAQARLSPIGPIGSPMGSPGARTIGNPDGSPPGARYGFDRDSAREGLASRFYDRGFAIPRQLHAVERNRQLAGAAFGYTPDPALDYGIASEPLTASWLPGQAQGGDGHRDGGRGRDYAVLLTATSRADKLWPDEDWRALGTALIATGLTCVLPGGSAPERQRAARLATALGRAVAAPPMGLAEMARLLAGARLVVGVDTGLVHLAAALGRPTLGIFCASDPTLTGVLAGGTPALNLGGQNAPPSPSMVVAAALGLIA